MDEKNQEGTIFRHSPILGSGKAVTQPLIRPKRQALIAMIDRSTSMRAESKIVQANAALAACISTLREPQNGDAFFVGVVTFCDVAEEHLAPQPALQIPMEKLGVTIGKCGTDIAAALDLARALLDKIPTTSAWARPIGLLLTDGEHAARTDPVAAANAFKKHGDLICVGFGSKADLGLLKRLATSNEQAVRVTDGAELRRHFVNIATSMSIASRPGQQAADLIGSRRSVVRG